MSKWQRQSIIVSVCFLCIGVLLVVAASCEASPTSGLCQCPTPFVGASSINLEFMETMSSTNCAAAQPCPVGRGIPLTSSTADSSTFPFLQFLTFWCQRCWKNSCMVCQQNPKNATQACPWLCLLVYFEFQFNSHMLNDSIHVDGRRCFLLFFHDETRSKIVDNNSTPCHLLVSYK